MLRLMPQFSEGDRVRVDIPDERDPDHEKYHGAHGEVTAVLMDDAGTVTGEPRDGHLYRVQLDVGPEVDFRRRDLRPPIEDSPSS